jgi:hypothetical protein
MGGRDGRHVESRESGDRSVGEIPDARQLDRRSSDGERCRLVDGHLMVFAIEIHEASRQPSEAPAIDRVGGPGPADDADLPQHERNARVRRSLGHEEVRRIEELYPTAARIDAEVGEQAIDGRHGREELSSEPLHPRTPHGFVTRVVEDGGVPVRHHAHVAAASYPLERTLDELLLDVALISTGSIELRHRFRRPIEPMDPRCRCSLGEEIEDVVGALDTSASLGGQMQAGPDPCADRDEGTTFA